MKCAEPYDKQDFVQGKDQILEELKSLRIAIDKIEFLSQEISGSPLSKKEESESMYLDLPLSKVIELTPKILIGYTARLQNLRFKIATSLKMEEV
ncbi:MAG: hypothetical protein WC188_02305 [Candidatus Caldatribacteriota bacterium]